MFKSTLKINSILVATATVFTFSACSETGRGTTDDPAAHEHRAGDEMAASGQVVVQTPDYKAVAGPVKDQVAQVLDGYLQLKDALVASDAQTAQERAQSVQREAEQVNLSGLEAEQRQFAEARLNEIKQSAAGIAGATELGAQRENLEPMSEAVFALTKAFGAADQTLYYQHCPMANNNAGAYWVSNTSEIRNPYFGESMLKCGSNEEVLQ
jgi:hypothetical protein